MLIAIVVIASSLVLSASAQTTMSPECVAAYNAVFNNASTENCSMAYDRVFEPNGNATDEQIMMVCDSSEQCNMMIENVIDICGDMVSLYTIAMHDVV